MSERQVKWHEEDHVPGISFRTMLNLCNPFRIIDSLELIYKYLETIQYNLLIVFSPVTPDLG